MNLEADRLNRGLSATAAAKKIGVSAGLLLRAEGGAMPNPSAAKKIADFYGYKVTDIWPVEKAGV